MSTRDIIEILVLFVSLVAPIFFGYFKDKLTSDPKKTYRLPKDQSYLESLISVLHFILLIAILSGGSLLLAYIIKSRITYIIMFLCGTITYNVLNDVLDRRLGKYCDPLEKQIHWYVNVKYKMITQTYLISLSISYGIDNIFGITSMEKFYLGWIYLGMFVITFPAYSNIYVSFFTKYYTLYKYEIRLRNGNAYKAEKIYETPSTTVISNNWSDGQRKRNYLEIRNDLVSSVSTSIESIDIKQYLIDNKKNKKEMSTSIISKA